MLPDSVANQIAAGEVIQRPASVVKELIENAIDAGASEITLVVKDAGRSLVQMLDNGSGMSSLDARVCFERHATSKITSADQLFSLETKGFRGEALASIAAIAQVELKTKMADDELGTKLTIEASRVKSEEPCQTANGSSFSVKNLFYNVPARRNFLKSDGVELKHIIEEFQRVAIPHFSIAFKLYHNGNELFNLPSQGARQRLVAIFGAKYDERLVPVQEDTDIVRIEGFIGKPQFAKRTRGEQYFFVNDRFIKSSYLNHAVTKAYEDLLPERSFAFYCLFLTIDPSLIDVNIHPTKTEIKFQDERAIYAILRSSVRQALGKFNVAPSLDFDQESSLNLGDFDKNKQMVVPSIQVNPDYNPFEQTKSSGTSSSGSSVGFGSQGKATPEHWKALYDVSDELDAIKSSNPEPVVQGKMDLTPETDQPIFQLHRKFIVTQIRSGLMLVDQHRAHQRILFEQFTESLAHQDGATQQSLFPETIQLSPGDHALVVGMINELQALGFDLDDFGSHCVVVRGVPVEAQDHSAEVLLENFVEQLKHSADQSGIPGQQEIAKALSLSSAIPYGKLMNEQEMRSLIDQLFACQVPYYSPKGHTTVSTLKLEDIAQKFV
ncbi:MAG: DNA mismatch repair endonuclease MutL, partial [Flavobacteriales bacterium]